MRLLRAIVRAIVWRLPRWWPIHLRRGVWRLRPVPAASAGVTTMLIDDELRLLHVLAEDYYRGKGVIIDAGSFLGGSTVALADGLRANLARRRRRERPLLHAFDLFQVEEWTRGTLMPVEARAGDSTRALFDANIAPYAPLVVTHEGDITARRWGGKPIEILFIDIAKKVETCDWITENLFPHLIPGRSIVVQQDYLYHEWTAWLHVTMEHYSDEFEILCDTWYNSVAFRLRKRFARGRLCPRLVETMPLARQIELMDRAAGRFPEAQAAWLRQAKDFYLARVEGG